MKCGCKWKWTLGAESWIAIRGEADWAENVWGVFEYGKCFVLWWTKVERTFFFIKILKIKNLATKNFKIIKKFGSFFPTSVMRDVKRQRGKIKEIPCECWWSLD